MIGRLIAIVVLVIMIGCESKPQPPLRVRKWRIENNGPVGIAIYKYASERPRVYMTPKTARRIAKELQDIADKIDPNGV